MISVVFSSPPSMSFSHFFFPLLTFVTLPLLTPLPLPSPLLPLIFILHLPLILLVLSCHTPPASPPSSHCSYSPTPSSLSLLPLVEVSPLQAADKEGDDRLLRAVLSWQMPHSLPPYLRPGSRRTPAPGRLALHSSRHLLQTQGIHHPRGT